MCRWVGLSIPLIAMVVGGAMIVGGGGGGIEGGASLGGGGGASCGYWMLNILTVKNCL